MNKNSVLTNCTAYQGTTDLPLDGHINYLCKDLIVLSQDKPSLYTFIYLYILAQIWLKAIFIERTNVDPIPYQFATQKQSRKRREDLKVI